MKKMKVLSISLMCLMLVLLAACSNSSKDEGTKEDTKQTDTATTTTTEPAKEEAVADEPEAVVEDPIDLGGRTITLSAWWDLTPAGDTASSKALLDQKAAVEKKYNVTIKYLNVPYGDYQKQYTAGVIAGTPMADVSIVETKDALNSALTGQLYKLSEFTTSDSDINNAHKLMQKMKPIAGDEYMFNTPGNTGWGLMYNRAIFKELGLPDLQELYNNGEWNWDKFLEVAKLGTKDTNNDGKIDRWGYAGWSAELGRHLAAANGAKIADDATGKEGLTDPKTIAVLELINKMWNVDKVVKVKSGKKTEWTERDTYKDGDSAMWAGAEWMMGDSTLDFGIVPFPLGPSGTKEGTFSENTGNGYVIPKGVKDPGVVYQIFEELYNIPPIEEYPSQDYLEGKYKTQEDIDMVVNHIANTGVVELDEAYANFPYYTVLEEILNNNVSVTAAVEKHKQEAQAAMDALGKQ